MRKLKLKKISVVPPSIELLFDNERLDLIKTLCLLYAFYLKSKKKFNKIPDIIFYYSVINFDLIKLFEINETHRKVETNLPFRFQAKINKILLELSNLSYIEIKGDLSYKTNDLGVRLTSEAVEFLMEMDIPLISNLIDDYITVINKIENTSENKRKIRGGV